MENKLLEIITKKNISFKGLIELLQITDSNEIEFIKKTLNKLIKNQKIFLNIKNKYEAITKEHIIAKLQSCSRNTKYVKFNNEKIYIPEENLHTALKNDLVIVEPTLSNKGEVVGIIERKNNKLVCEVKEKNDKLYLVPFNGNCELALRTPKELLTNLIIGDRVFVEIDNKVDEDNTINVTSVTKIGHFNDKMNDEIAIAISKDFDIDFSEETMKEVEKIPEYVLDSEKENRLDLTNENIFTLDSIRTKDMDDAISIKKLYNGNYLLGVHIADVSHYLPTTSPIFKEAMKRGTSVYLDDLVITMIPSKLSNCICSLNEGFDRLTKSVIMEVNKKGKVVNYKIVYSVIHSKKKMTYEELNKMFETQEIEEETYIPFIQDIEFARELSNILTKNKSKRGNLDFESKDRKIIKDENGKPQEFIKETNGEAQKIIENFMVLTNEVVASHFHWRGLPFVYRVHNNPDELKIDKTMDVIKKLGYKLTHIQNAYGQKEIQNILNEYKDKPEYTIISNLLLRNMSKAIYSTENYGHFALALDNYCHFTSPIRRFPDLAVHTLIDMFINDYRLDNHNNKFVKNLGEICTHSSYKERQSKDAESDNLKLKMAEYMAAHKNEEFEGYVLDMDRENVYIKLDNNIKGILDLNSDMNNAFEIDYSSKTLKCKHSKQKISLGTKIIFKVSDVNIPQKEILFEIKEIVKNNNHTKKLELK